jgi:hypothetical protein
MTASLSGPRRWRRCGDAICFIVLHMPRRTRPSTGQRLVMRERLRRRHGNHLSSQLSASALNWPGSCWCMKWPPGMT